MTDDESKYLKKVVDGSGFPLQVKLEGVINQTPNWNVEGREIFWKSDSRNGFIDIIASHSYTPIKLFVEVKKTSGGEWIFLSHEGQQKKDERAIVLTADDTETRFVWNEIILPFSTEKFAFCAVTGQKNSHNPLLERLCSEVLMSMEGYIQDQDFESISWGDIKRNTLPVFRSVISVIVTNTCLYKCHYNSDKVDLSEGIISGDVKFEKVKYLAFTKPFWSEIDVALDSPGYLSKYPINEKQDRTVFVVNSNYLRKFLIDLDPYQA